MLWIHVVVLIYKLSNFIWIWSIFPPFLLSSVCRPSHFGCLDDIFASALWFSFFSKGSYWFYFHFCWVWLTNQSFHLPFQKILICWLFSMYDIFQTSTFSASRLIHTIGLKWSNDINVLQTHLELSIILGKGFLLCFPLVYSL